MAWELFGSYGYWAGGTPAEGFPVTSAVDIFSFGVMLWEVVTHERPDRSKGALRQLRYVSFLRVTFADRLGGD